MEVSVPSQKGAARCHSVKKRDLQCWVSSHPRHSAPLVFRLLPVLSTAYSDQNDLKIFPNTSLFPWGILLRQLSDSVCGLPAAGSEHVSPGGADSCWEWIHHPGARGRVIAHSHSSSCRHQAAWQDENGVYDLYSISASAVVTLPGASDPVAWLLAGPSLRSRQGP